MSEEPFAVWLRRELDARKWSRVGFARRVGVSYAAVHGWLAGCAYPSRDNAAEIARAFAIPKDAIPPRPRQRSKWTKAAP